MLAPWQPERIFLRARGGSSGRVEALDALFVSTARFNKALQILKTYARSHHGLTHRPRGGAFKHIKGCFIQNV